MGVLGWLVITLAVWIALNLGVFVLLLLRSNASQRKRTQPKPGFEAGHNGPLGALCALGALADEGTASSLYSELPWFGQPSFIYRDYQLPLSWGIALRWMVCPRWLFR